MGRWTHAQRTAPCVHGFHISVVDDPAVRPDLGVAAGLLHADAGHLHHGLPELPLPPPAGARAVPHHPRRLRGLQQRRVGGEQHPALQHVAVVLAVQLRRGHRVLAHRRVILFLLLGAVLRLLDAPPPQRPRERRVDVGVAVDGRAVRGEGRAAGVAHGVRAGEHDHVLCVETLVGEIVDELGVGSGARGQGRDRVGGVRAAAVEAARRHGEVDAVAAQEVGRVARGEGDDVGAGDGAGARLLHGGLGRVDRLEAPQAVDVGRAELLRPRVRRRRVQQHRRVAALHDIIYARIRVSDFSH
uniref:Uncharacterized protein n=1 Tax=Hordeum vulgare subsp. vulgare TaxID=112509 RepID=A0A8I6WS13_HORVV